MATSDPIYMFNRVKGRKKSFETSTWTQLTLPEQIISASTRDKVLKELEQVLNMDLVNDSLQVFNEDPFY